MSDALQTVELIRSDLRPLEHRILGHRYLKALDGGHLQRDQLEVFVGQQHHIISSDLRSIALMISRHGVRPSRHFLMNVLQGESAAMDALQVFANALGLDVNNLENIEPLPSAHAYCGFVAWLALNGSDAELAGAFLINLPAWGANCGRMRKALHEKYRVGPSGLAFFDLFANMPSFEQEALRVIQYALDGSVPARLIHRAARMVQNYELMFWDALADVAAIPL